jgi:uncharacterized membrane protein YsdA (DUF1294 family)
MLPAALVYLALLLAMSTVTVLVYWWDKRRAQAGGRRVPEKVLHLLAVGGGWPGAWWAQRRLRHKTQKVRFLTVFWLLVAVHLAAVGVAAYLLFASNTARPTG